MFVCFRDISNIDKKNINYVLLSRVTVYNMQSLKVYNRAEACELDCYL